MPIVSELILSLMLTASLSAGAPLSAPPGLAVSLPAITAQAQQLPPPLMILPAGGVTPEGVTGRNSLEALEPSYENGYRLLELGFIPGTIVRAVQISPLGDPVAYEVLDAVIALRRCDARCLHITAL